MSLHPCVSTSVHLGLSNASSMNQEYMENLRLEKQRFRLLHTSLAMLISQVAIFVQVNQQHPWGWKSVW